MLKTVKLMIAVLLAAGAGTLNAQNNIFVETIPTGLEVMVDGTPLTTPQLLLWASSELHELEADSLQPGSPGIRYRWDSWNSGAPRVHFVAPESDTTYVASFLTQYLLTISSNPAAGGTTLPTASVYYDSGAVASISAIPNSGYVFTGWSGDTSGTGNPVLLTMDGPKSVTAIFTPLYDITVGSSPAGRTITVDGISYTAPQTFSWLSGSTHSITTDSVQNGASGTRYVWNSWSSGGGQTLTVIPTSDTTFVANFSTEYFLTMNAGSGGSVNPPGGWYAEDSIVEISATPSSGYSFAGWAGSGPGSYSGTNNPATVTMNGPVSQSASFTLILSQVEIRTIPSGLTVVVDGANFLSPSTFSFVPGSLHTISVPSTQAGPPGVRYAWDSWSDGGDVNHTITVTQDSILVALFTTQFELTVTSTPVSGGSTIPTGSNFVDSGSTVNITATPAANYAFLGWSGDATGTDNPLSFTVTAPATIVAGFGATVDVTIETNPPGLSYTVDSVFHNTSQTFTWLSGSSHEISTNAIESGPPGLQYVWQNWSDGGGRTHTITPLASQTITAGFQIQYALTVTSNPPAGGTTTPFGVSFHNADAEVSILAIPNSGYRFGGWTGNASGTTNPVDVLVDGPKNVTASFIRTVQTTVSTIPSGLSIEVDGVPYTSPMSFTWDAGSIHTIATSSVQTSGTDIRYLWTGWSDGGVISHAVSPAQDTTFTASFQTQYYLTMTVGSGGSVLPASSWHNSGESVAITATADPAYVFTGWTGTGNGSYSGPVNPSFVTMNGPISENASFSQFPVNVTIQSAVPGRTFIVDGTTYTSSQSFVWNSGEPHTLSADSIQSGSTGIRYLYFGWSDGGGRTHSIIPISDTVLTVNFDTQFFLTMIANPGGTVSPPSGWHYQGSGVSIRAFPNTGYSFNGWSGTGSGSITGISNPVTITMNAPISETANFTQDPFQLTVGTNPPGRSFRYDGVVYTTTQTFTVTPGLTHTLAIPTNPQSGGAGRQYVWSNWSDGGEISHTILPLSDTTIIANFTTQFQLTTSAGTGGTVTPATAYFDSGSSVILTGIPNTAYRFTAWTGSGTGSYTGTLNPVTIVLQGPVTQTAAFAQYTIQATVQSNVPGRTFSVDGVEYTGSTVLTWTAGTSHTLTTTTPQSVDAGTRYIFGSWSDGGAMTHTVSSLTDTTFTVIFNPQYYLTMAAGTGGSVLPVSGWNDGGNVIPISATPTGAYVFSGWSGAGTGSYTGPDNPSAIRMDGPITQTASFTQFPVRVYLATLPPGGTITVDGVTYATPETLTWSSGTVHTLSSDSIQGLTDTRLLWTGWKDGGSRIRSVSTIRDTSFTATFRSQYYLTMNPASGGSSTPLSSWQDSAAVVDITAVPSSGYDFAGWTGTGSGSYTGPLNPATVTMLGPVSETPSFIQGDVSVTVRTNPPNRTFAVDGTTYTNLQTFTWTAGSIHLLSADSIQSGGTGTRHVWSNWNDGGALSHAVAPRQDTTIIVNFSTQHLLTMIANTGGTAEPATGWHSAGAIVSINAVPGNGYTFSRWSGVGNGSYSGSNNPVNITMNGPITETASFTQNQVQVTIMTNPPGRSFRVDGTTYTITQTFSFTPGSTHTLLTTSPQSGGSGIQYVWDSWSDGGAISHSIDAIADTTIVANFRTQYYLTMTPPTGGIVTPASGWFDRDQRVEIQAIPSAAYTFAGWIGSGNGSYTGPGNPDTIVMLGPISETANFTLFPVNVQIQTVPSGRAITVDGTVYASPQSFIWTSGTNHTISVDSLPTADSAGMRYEWRRWSDNGPRNHTVSATFDTTFVAFFDTQYVLTMNATSGGTVNPPTTWFRKGATVPITATPASGYNFGQWTGTGNGSYSGRDNPANVLMNGPVTETATFVLNPVSITVGTNPPGYSFIVDGTTYTTSQTFVWEIGSLHTIETDSIRSGPAGIRYLFTGWSDGGGRVHTFTPLKDSTVTATIVTQYFVTMSANTGGTVAPPSGWFNAGQRVSISAVASEGYEFNRWVGSGNGSYSGGNNPANINVDGPITETASFGLEPIRVTVQAFPAGRSFRVNGTQYITPQTFSFLPGATQTIGVFTNPQTVDSVTQYRFDRWSDGGAIVHSVAPTRDTTFTVYFTRQCLLSMQADTGGTVSPLTGWFDTAQTVIITATANSGFTFTGWIGTGEGSYTGPRNQDTVTMFGSVRQRATFSQNPVMVSVITDPRGLEFRVDEKTFADSQRFVWTKGSEHILQSVSPQPRGSGIRYVWKSWSNGAPDSQVVIPQSDSAFVVSYSRQHLLTMVVQPGGTVTPSTSWYDSARIVQITALPDSGYGFSGWTGSGYGSYSGTANPVTVSMLTEIQQLASFVNLGPPPVLSGPPDGAVNQSIVQNLGWLRYPQAISYRLQVAMDAQFDTIAVDTTVVSDTSIRIGPLNILTTYHWRVIVTVNGNITTVSRTRSFTTLLPSLSVSTPQRPWATTYTYIIRWTSTDLFGPVNISVSSSGGGAYQQIIANADNVGAAIWTIPAGQTLSTTYRMKIESVTYPAIFSESGIFPIVSGALSQSIPVSTLIPYPTDDVRTTDYRLVSMPGILNNVSFAGFVQGSHRIDWRAYLDDGTQDNYLVEQFPSSLLTTGRGYWLVQNRPLEYTGTMVMPPLTADAAYTIPLQTGWNIIANPFDRNVGWSDIQRENGIPSTSTIKGYEGTFRDESVLVPFRAYYYDNTLNLTQLKIPYPFGPATPPLVKPQPSWSMRIALTSDINADADNYIGVAEPARTGRDEFDHHKPPLFLDQGFLYFDRPEWDPLYTRFSSDFRPAIGDGQIWNFEVSNPRGSACTISFEKIDQVPDEYEIRLVNAYHTRPVDIRENPLYTFRSVAGKNPFAIIIGTPAFVEGEVEKFQPDDYELSRNFPNPFNATTTISYSLPAAGNVRIEVISILGQSIAVMDEGRKERGIYAVNWNGMTSGGEPVASGVYLYRLIVNGQFVKSHKLVIAK